MPGSTAWTRVRTPSRTTVHDPADDRSLSQGAAQVVHQDRDGTLWVGTGGGLDRMDPSTGGFIHYRHDPRDDATLGGSGISRCTRIAAATCGSGPSRG